MPESQAGDRAETREPRPLAADAGGPAPDQRPGALAARPLLGPGLFALAVAALGSVLLVESFSIGRTRGYSPVGPSIFPFAVSIGLIALGVIWDAQLLWRPDPAYRDAVASEEAATHWLTVGMLVAGIVVYAFLLRFLGYPLATAALFAYAARTLGSTRPLRDVVLGLAAGLVVWFAFTQALGVALPAGLLDPLLPGD